MPKQLPSHKIKQFPPERLPIVDLLKDAKKHSTIYAIAEVDVTKARNIIRDHKKNTGEKLSFTAFIAYCMAKAIDEDKILHARRKGKNKLVIFDDVDIMTMVEREFGAKTAPIGHIIREANKKSYREIHEEIRKAQVDTLGVDYQSKLQLKYKRLPWFMKKALWRKHAKNPYFKKKFTGTCSLTAVGMFGKGNAWGLVPSGDTVMMVLGGIGKKPAIINDKIEIREFLSVTLGFDHDIIDGAPAARFGMRLKNLIENADDLK